MTISEEKKQLEQINERFIAYVNHVRQLKGDDEMKEIGKSILSLENELKALKHSYECQISQLKCSLDIITEEKCELQREVMSRKNNQLHLVDRISVESTKNSKLILDVSALKTEMSEKDQFIVSLKLRIKQLEIENEKQKEKCEEVEAMLLNMRKRFDCSENIKHEYDNQIRSLKEKLCYQEKLSSELINLQIQLDAERKSNKEFKENNEQLTAMILELRKTEAETSSKLHSLECQLSLSEAALHNEQTEAHRRSEAADARQLQLEATVAAHAAETAEAREAEKLVRCEIVRLRNMLEEEEARLRLFQALPASPSNFFVLPNALQQASVNNKHNFDEGQINITLPPKRIDGAGDAATVSEDEEIQTETGLDEKTNKEENNQMNLQERIKVDGEHCAVINNIDRLEEIDETVEAKQQHKLEADLITSTNNVYGDLEALIPTPTATPRLTVGPMFRLSDKDRIVSTTDQTSSDGCGNVINVAEPGLSTQVATTFVSLSSTSFGQPMSTTTMTGPTGKLVSQSAVDLSPVDLTKTADGVGQQQQLGTAAAAKTEGLGLLIGAGRDYLDDIFSPLHHRPVEQRQLVPSDENFPAGASAIGNFRFFELDTEGKFLRVWNSSDCHELDVGGYAVSQCVGGQPVLLFRFPSRLRLPARAVVTLWAGGLANSRQRHRPPADFRCADVSRWGTGPHFTAILTNPAGQAVAWLTSPHRSPPNTDLRAIPTAATTASSSRIALASKGEQASASDGTTSACLAVANSSRRRLLPDQRFLVCQTLRTPSYSPVRKTIQSRFPFSSPPPNTPATASSAAACMVEQSLRSAIRRRVGSTGVPASSGICGVDNEEQVPSSTKLSSRVGQLSRSATTSCAISPPLWQQQFASGQVSDTQARRDGSGAFHHYSYPQPHSQVNHSYYSQMTSGQQRKGQTRSRRVEGETGVVKGHQEVVGTGLNEVWPAMQKSATDLPLRLRAQPARAYAHTRHRSAAALQKLCQIFEWGSRQQETVGSGGGITRANVVGLPY